MITMKHIDNMAKIICFTGSIVGYAYLMELFVSYYSASPYEGDAFRLRTLSGPYVWSYWVMMFCNVAAPQVFLVRKNAAESLGSDAHLYVREHRNVVRALLSSS